MKSPEMIRQDFNVTIQSSNANERTVTCIIVSKQTNRGGRRIDIEGCRYDDYLKSPVVLAFHDDTKIIGRCLWLKFGEEGIIAKFEFRNSELANDIYSLYREGFLTSWSIGFLPVKWQYENENGKEVMHITEWILLEVSAVSIPMDANAITLAFSQGFIHEASLVQTAEFTRIEGLVRALNEKAESALSEIILIKDNLECRTQEMLTALSSLAAAQKERESHLLEESEGGSSSLSGAAGTELTDDLIKELTAAITDHINTKRGIL